jgi:hypothetical protein
LPDTLQLCSGEFLPQRDSLAVAQVHGLASVVRGQYSMALCGKQGKLGSLLQYNHILFRSRPHLRHLRLDIILNAFGTFVERLRILPHLAQLKTLHIFVQDDIQGPDTVKDKNFSVFKCSRYKFAGRALSNLIRKTLDVAVKRVWFPHLTDISVDLSHVYATTNGQDEARGRRGWSVYYLHAMWLQYTHHCIDQAPELKHASIPRVLFEKWDACARGSECSELYAALEMEETNHPGAIEAELQHCGNALLVSAAQKLHSFRCAVHVEGLHQCRWQYLKIPGNNIVATHSAKHVVC